ncbi:MAG: CRISPR-associated endonuclease Cas1, partial [Cloacibacillus sp.]
MKRLLNSLFVMTQGAWLSQKGENIIVHLNKEESRAFPLHLFDSVLCFGQVNVTPPLLGFCAENGVPISFFTEYGKFLASVHGPVSGNVLLRKEQYRISDAALRSVCIVRSLLAAKINNSRTVLQRFLRDHPQDGPIEKKFRENIAQLEGYLAQLRDKNDIEEMRGIEGISARLYFDLFDTLIVQQKDDFIFTERNRRPPRDRVNAMLSFVYALLANDVKSALQGVGLDPAVGFLHKDRPGRAS